MLEIIAEFGTNNIDPEGNIHPNLEDLIKTLSVKGAHTVKFQHLKADGLAAKGCELWDILKKLEQPIESHIRFKEMCKNAGVKYLCTPLCLETLNELLDIGVREIKIASCDCGNLQMMEELVQNKNKIDRVIMSTGMSTMGEIALSMDILLRADFKVDLLHCVSSYPTKELNASLGAIKVLRKHFGHIVRVGYSDHTISVYTAAIARALGCEIFEKHVTHNRAAPGFDHPYSFPVETFDDYVGAIEEVGIIIGKEEKVILENEETPRQLMKRGIWFNNDLEKGHILTKDDITLRRPLKGSIDTTAYFSVLGKRLTESVKEGESVKLENLCD